MNEDNQNENMEEENEEDSLDNQNENISKGNPVRNFIKAPLTPIRKVMEKTFNKNNANKVEFTKFFFTSNKKFKLFLLGFAIFVVIVATIVISIGYDSSSTVTSSQSAAIAKLGLSENSTGIDGEAYKLYNTYDSFLAMNKDQLNAIYESLASEDSTRSNYIVNSSKIEYGSSTNDKDKYNLNYKRKLYEHILRTEKYNFNQIKWLESSHNDESKDLKTEDNDSLELKVPEKTDEDTLKTIFDTVSPFLLTNNIPMGMLAGTYNLANYNNNDQTTSGVLVYNIIKETMTRMVVHKYTLRELKYNTYAEEYTTTKYKGKVTLNYKDGVVTLVSAPTYVQDGDAVQGKKDEAKIGNDTIKEDVYWYVDEAYTYDAYIKNEFEHKVYSDSDAKKMINPTSNSLIDTKQIDEVNGNIIVDINSVPQELISRVKEYVINNLNNPEFVNRKNEDGSYTFTYDTSYTRRYGKGYTYEKTYSDQLIPKSSVNNKYKYDDMVSYNTTETKDEYKSIESNRKTVDEDYFKERTTGLKEYENEDPTNGLYGLSLIDFMDSNQSIYKNYFNTSNDNTLSGIGRYYLKEGYVQIKNLINNLLEKTKSEKTVPWVYGSSLGYETTSVSYQSSGSSGSTLAGMDLLKAYLRSREGNEGIADENGNTLPSSQIENAKFYKVGMVSNGKGGATRTVGYGIDLDKSGYEPQILQAMGRTEKLSAGELVPIEIVDKCEEDEIKKAIDAVKAEFADVDLKEYQIHALVSRYYNCGSAGWKWEKYSSSKKTIVQAYKDLWNEENDDKYESLYEKYKDNPENSSEITSNADYNNSFYLDIMNKPTNNGILVTRRQSEWMVFSMGYYDSLKKFYSGGGSTPGDIDLYNSDGTVNESKCEELTNWYVDNLFSGNSHMRFPPGTSGMKNGVAAIEVSPSMTSFLNYENYPYLKNVFTTYQCTWWARVRGSMQAQMLDPEHFKGGIYTNGDGHEVAKKTAEHYKVSLNMNIEEIKPNSIVSFNEYSKNNPYAGHVAYVEAVDYKNRVFYVSHCGGGKQWYGITKKSFDKYSGGNAHYFGGSVSIEDIVNSSVYKGGN